jgi:hypothetical protein
MKSRNVEIIMFMAIGAILALTIARLYGRLKRVEKYTRGELQRELEGLIEDLERDGVLSQEIVDVQV